MVPGASLLAFKPKRGKALTILLLPLLACMIFIGFCQMCVGEKKTSSEIKPEQSTKESVSILPVNFEEQEEEIYV